MLRYSASVAACVAALTGTSPSLAGTDISPVPLPTFTAAARTEVKPNILMVLDDSGSMSWDFLPDIVGTYASNYRTIPPFHRYNGSFNSIFYNPTVTYLPPIDFGADGKKNLGRFPSMTGTSTATGADITKALPNWGRVPKDGYMVQSSDFQDLSSTARYWYSVAGEYCNSPRLASCIASDSPQPGFEYPAVLRWCDDADLRNCQANSIPPYIYPRISAPRVSIVTFTADAGGEITGLRVATDPLDPGSGLQIMAGTTGSQPDSESLATALAAKINNCTLAPAGACAAVGYQATSIGKHVVISAPGTRGGMPGLDWSSTSTPSATVTAFAKSRTPTPDVQFNAYRVRYSTLPIGATSDDVVPGETYFTAITPSVPMYSYAETGAKAPTRTDCASDRCTYVEEMINFANWSAYYRTRMQTMKTSLSRAFAALDTESDIAAGLTHYRVGYMTINNGGGRDFVNIADFDGSQKHLWFSSVFASKPAGETPLRAALSTAGRLYGGTIGSTVNGVIPTDPLQYSCQRNYSILSTDGYWNGASGTKLDGSTPLGNSDAALPSPYGGPADSDTLADIADYYYRTDLRSPAAAGAVGSATCTGPVIPPSTTPTDLCTDNVPPSGRDTAPHQHMTTSTLSFGAPGRMIASLYQNDASGKRTYIPDFWQQRSGDFYDVANSSTATPDAGVCPWMDVGQICNWPSPASAYSVDDLWHAAVNGHGTYFYADNPLALAYALRTVLTQLAIAPRRGTAAAAVISNPNVTDTDNLEFSSSYRSSEWFGELVMRRIDRDGMVGAQQWSARQPLDCWTTPWTADFAYTAGDAFKFGASCYVVLKDYVSADTFEGYDGGVDASHTAVMPVAPGTRSVYTPNAAGNALVPFAWSSLSSGQKAYFSSPWIDYVDADTGLSQFCASGAVCLGGAARSDAQGAKLVAFLSGERTYEGMYYRVRRHVLGDIVTSGAAYVKAPWRAYRDAGFAEYKAAKAERQAMVYVGANDGMLHAFDALTGAERWAFIPSAVLPSLYRLADTNYAGKHRFYVDGTPDVGDICPKAPPLTCTADDWKTILVGGLGAGGNAYYALDITDPSAPKLLWEFTHPTLGLSFGNPQITKLANGTWVVIIASGYNNADGVGRLYVLDASKGALIGQPIPTGAGSPATPSGLAKIVAHAPTANTDNTVRRVYGGDLLGNMWRFDVNAAVLAAAPTAQLLINVTGAADAAQSITARPVVATLQGQPLVIFGTGKYLGHTDLTDTSTQTMYAVLDRGNPEPLPNPRKSERFVRQTAEDTTCPADSPAGICASGEMVRTVTSHPVDWTTHDGWYIDFVLPGERSVTDAKLVLGTVVFTTIRPQAPADGATGAVDPCSDIGTASNAQSFLYYLDYLTGGAVAGTNNVIGNIICVSCVATGVALVKTEDGTLKSYVRLSGDATRTQGDVNPHPCSTTPKTEGETDDAGNSCQAVPYGNPNSKLRKISWRDLNGE